ncbi:Fc.00g078400.m01.CDS01 [Cosmosporella sp. VM-42]
MSVAAVRPIILFIAITSFFVWILQQPHLRDPGHSISTTDSSLTLPKLDFGPDHAHRDYYSSEAAHEFCDAHGYSVFEPKSTSGERKIYDLFMVNTEMDFLEIRLNTLYDYVDYFVIVESPRTFQGRPKPLTIKENWDKFKQFHDKMIYHELQFPKGFKPKLTWDYEDLQRNAMYDQVIPALTGRQAAVEGDVLLVADADEIPRPSALLVLRSCNFPRRLTLGSKFYYYSFQFLHNGAEWPHPQATYYEGNKTLLPSNLRNGDAGVPLLRNFEKGQLGNAAWHCSSCFATVHEFLNKMASFSHMWMNEPEYQDRDKIATAVREGKDLWGRRKDTFRRIENNTDVPRFLLEEGERFKYMMNRDGETAGFTDYP